VPSTGNTMSLIVKICGLSTPEALDVALDAGADMVGFVFFSRSPRHVSLTTARSLGARVEGRAKKVALSVDADDATLGAVVAALQPDMLQLHGKEPPARVAALRTRFGIPVMKAIAVEAKGDLESIESYATVADWILFDARAPHEATRPGGLGKPFEWTLLRGLAPRLPFILSGGLNPENVKQALSITQIDAVDVSSGVERVPGVKDSDKIRAFVRAARTAHIASRTLASPA
jgi:phosphoribosylanthranilate isomerase